MASPLPASVPDWKLERFLLGELPESELVAIRERLLTDPALAGRIQALERDNVAILRAYDPKEESRRLEGQLRMQAVEAARREARRRPVFVGATLLATGVAAVLFLTLPRLTDDQARLGLGDSRDEGVRLKGDAQLSLARERQGASELLRSGDHAKAGDLLQVSYRTNVGVFGAILSIDGRGSVTWHFPERFPDGDRAQPLVPGELTPLSHAYELDDAPLVERFILVTAPKAFGLAPIMDAAERLGREPAAVADPQRGLSLPPGLVQTSFIVRKDGAP